MWITVCLCIIFFACLATLYTEGLWGNAVLLINVITAGLLAMNFFEPVANWLEGLLPSFTYACDFLALWGLFGALMLVFRLGADYLSRVKVRFLKIADQIGSIALACWIGWVMVCFTAMSLHTAPMAKNFLGGSFQPEQRMFFGQAPDRQWLGFTQKMSKGAFARSASEADWKSEKYVFDPRSEFMPKYNTRRGEVENQVKSKKTIRVK
jgi:hypothetical protein